MVIDDFDCNLCLHPVYWQKFPRVSVLLDREVVWQGDLQKDLDLKIYRALARKEHVLEIEFSGKENSDSLPEADLAVVIEQVQFFGITDDKFKWQGIYRPQYPEPWRSEQLAKGITLPDQLIAQDYLGWNGTWRLEFTTPIFTWIHRVQDLGWIYD